MININLREELSCSGKNCFDDNFFTNSLSGDIAHLSYKGLATEQNPNIIYPFNTLIGNIRPSRIIEIGTFYGGLTLILRALLHNNMLYSSQIFTYDVNCPSHLLSLINESSNVRSYTKNLFSESYSNFSNEENKEEIISLIQDNGTTLVLCDGGCKKCEFNILSSYLKSNDIIMAHDYCPNRNYFEDNMRGKQWNWCEIEDKDIDNSIITNNLTKFMYEDFLSVGWLCMKKS
jgi:hypothetical protein